MYTRNKFRNYCSVHISFEMYLCSIGDSSDEFCCDVVKEVKGSLIDLMEKEFNCCICGEIFIEVMFLLFLFYNRRYLSQIKYFNFSVPVLYYCFRRPSQTVTMFSVPIV